MSDTPCEMIVHSVMLSKDIDLTVFTPLIVKKPVCTVGQVGSDKDTAWFILEGDGPFPGRSQGFTKCSGNV